MSWRESLSQRKSTSDENIEALAPPVIVDDVPQFDTVTSELNGDLSLKGVTSSLVGNGPCMASSSAVNVTHINYELVGVVVHSGQANAGHYYSFIKDRRFVLVPSCLKPCCHCVKLVVLIFIVDLLWI